MTTTSFAPELVVLRGGLSVPQAAVDLLLDLERRGLDLHLDTADGAVICRPARLLTDDDKQAITALRDALKVLIAYCEAVDLMGAGCRSLVETARSASHAAIAARGVPSQWSLL
jgi:hypothetical protein